MHYSRLCTIERSVVIEFDNSSEVSHGFLYEKR